MLFVVLGGGLAYVLFVMAGGWAQVEAQSQVDGRSYHADTPMTASELVDLKVPKGFEDEPIVPSVLDATPPDKTIFFTLSLGRFSHIGGTQRSARLVVMVSEQGQEALVLPPESEAWQLVSSQGNISLHERAAEHPSVLAVDRGRGLRVGLVLDKPIYNQAQALEICREVLASLEPRRPALNALFARSKKR